MTVDMPLICIKNGKYHELKIGKEIPLSDVSPINVIVGSNGLFIMRNLMTHTSFEKVDIKDSLYNNFDQIKEKVDYNFPSIPYKIYKQALKFFRDVYEEYKSEGNIILYLNKNIPIDNQEYVIYIPEQKVSSASVNYTIGKDAPKESEGYYQAGSIHSHPSFSAFQSGTDLRDEITFDGIHVTIGHITRENPEIDVRLCASGSIYKLDHTKKEGIIIEKEDDTQIPKEWIKKVSKVIQAGFNQKSLTKNYQVPDTTTHPKTYEESTPVIITKIWELFKPEIITYKDSRSIQPLIKDEECKILS